MTLEYDEKSTVSLKLRCSHRTLFLRNPFLSLLSFFGRSSESDAALFSIQILVFLALFRSKSVSQPQWLLFKILYPSILHVIDNISMFSDSWIVCNHDNCFPIFFMNLIKKRNNLFTVLLIQVSSWFITKD